MNKLYTLLYPTPTPIRHFSLITHYIKSAPKNLKLIVTEGDSADKARLVDFYSQTYLRDDPVVRAAGIEDLTELKQFLDTSLKSLHSVLLTDREGTIVMAAASGGPVTYTTAAQMRLYADRDMKDDRSRRLVHLWASITSESDMLNRLHVPALWDISYISTAPQMRRYGLARFLLVQHRRLASKLGYPVLCLECTNQCLVRAAQKMGFQGMEGRSLDSYLNPSGESWISAPPHLQVQVFCRMLGGKVEPDFRLQ